MTEFTTLFLLFLTRAFRIPRESSGKNQREIPKINLSNVLIKSVGIREKWKGQVHSYLSKIP